MSSLANRYARALTDAAGADLPTVATEIKAFHQLVTTHTELADALANPTIPLAQKEGLLRALCARLKPHPVTSNFLGVLLRNQRMAALGDIQSAIEAVVDERSGIVPVEVTSAMALGVSERRVLERRLKEAIGSDIRVTYRESPDLIGGLVTRVGSTYYDGSVRTQLVELRERLARRA
ncbi:MAG: ATP synthase F1 subunit delta [Chloracidobacterium sp.]|uniref:ATP synthase subunit delta n=1 Tax=Chloracidobacterium validum TaxID=2821543 RepID=A0ABX8B579_9BACT|nr:ATP synthase F1 subunit delta [Chloracidobacterium validum]QUW02123.1 ATP synthase F1 subunit delta [Chloracidobacterium validum]